jgi:hypothetical protein
MANPTPKNTPDGSNHVPAPNTKLPGIIKPAALGGPAKVKVVQLPPPGSAGVPPAPKPAAPPKPA